MSDITERTYSVRGMTCDHCRTSVAGQVERVQGVVGVEIDLQTRRLIVSGSDISDAAVHAAVNKAGYRVASA